MLIDTANHHHFLLNYKGQEFVVLQVLLIVENVAAVYHFGNDRLKKLSHTVVVRVAQIEIALGCKQQKWRKRILIIIHIHNY